MYNLILLLVLSPYTALLIGIYTTYKMVKMKDEIQKNTWNIGLLLLFLWSFIVGVLNKSVISSLASIIFFLYFSISQYLQCYCKTEDKIKLISDYLIKFSIFSGAIGIIEKLSFAYFPMELWKKFLNVPLTVTTNHRIYSTFGNPNVTGDWFGIMIIIALYYGSMCKDNKSKILYYGSVFLFLINLCLTGSRGAYVGFLIGLAVLFVLKKNKNDFVVFLAIALIVGIVGFTPEKVSNISQEVTSHQMERSFNTREEIWRGSLRMIKEKPITGWGLWGTVENGNRFSRYQGIIYHSHNIWISLLSFMGLLGLSIYLFMRIRIYKNLLYLFKSNCSSAILLLAIQLIVLVHGAIDFTIITPQIGMLFIGTSSIITSLANEETSSVLSKRSSFAFKNIL